MHGRRRALQRRPVHRSERAIPGGVNSSIRAFRSVGGRPYVVARAEGPYVWDVEGTRYIDLVQSYGAVILGHAHPAITRALVAAAPDGTSYGAPTPREMKLAEQIAAARAELRTGAADELRHRGDEHRRAARPRVHGPGPADRRSTATSTAPPTPCWPPAAAASPRSGSPGHGGRAGRRRRRDDGRAVQRGARHRRRRGRRDRRAGGRQHGRGRPAPGVPGGPARGVRPGRRAADLRRGDHRVPPRQRRRPGEVRRARPTSRRSAR